MSKVIDISLIRLVEQGKKDPNEITDSLIAAGYEREFTPEQLAIATQAVKEAFSQLDLPSHLMATTTKDISDFVLNAIVDSALQDSNYAPTKLVTQIIASGFKKGVTHG